VLVQSRSFLTPSAATERSGGATVTTPGGLYALPGNIGHYTHDEFSVVPELGINVGYQVTNQRPLAAVAVGFGSALPQGDPGRSL
jgi:Putative beta barrel porin-7 (BBP7)